MCPEKSILSAWFDGEVDGKWSVEIESHLQSCSDCSSYIAKLKDQRMLLQSLPLPEFRDSLELVKLSVREKNTVEGSTRFWERRISLPVAAAAAFIAATVSFGTHMLAGNRNDQLQMASLADQNYTAQVYGFPGENIDEIFRTMETAYSDEFTSNSIMELPSDVNLIFNGESQLVRSAGFSGGTSP
jgi:hypothetical protein